MKIAEGIHMLDISSEVTGKTETVHPMLIASDQSAVLVDTGFPGQFDQLKATLADHDVPLEKLTDILITHQDLDHIGNLPQVVAESSPQVRVWAHEAEQPYIQGEKSLLKYKLEAVEQLPKEVPEAFREGLKSLILNPPTARVDQLLEDGQELPIAGGITVIFTPGHSPGHLSLYLNESKTLIAADAMMVDDGQLNGPAPQATPDMNLANQSLKKFIPHDIEKVVCYHGGLFEDDPNKRISELANAD
ncbi:MAG TPA: MBL fold metallo-hydrolase [Bacillales bacterium]|nr:MBL fold metallo-hydrolase [Bacillales bacterium]